MSQVSFDPILAERRFGYGVSPTVAPPASVADMLSGVAGPDRMAAQFPLPPYRHLQDQLVLNRRFRQYARNNPDTEEGQAAEEKVKRLKRQMRRDRLSWFGHLMSRRINTSSAFRERLVAFWADHFTAIGKAGMTAGATPLYEEAAIRPRIGGRFEDLLISAVSHPLMLHYLDQASSAGPNSPVGKRRQRGLNENLAREILELHTLGVGGPYDQTDVRAFAALLAGLSTTRDYGFKFRPNMVEPGPKTILGKTYTPDRTIAPVQAALRDLARHPATAQHIAMKLAVHFLSDTPPEEAVAAMTAAYVTSDGDLMAVYEALLSHSAAWAPETVNMRPPLEYVSTALRMLGLPATRFDGMRPRDLQVLFLQPMAVMGQQVGRPGGPDGWPEEDTAWISPQGVAARLEWAMQAPVRLMKTLPEPEAFLDTALAGQAPPEVRFAVNAAENRAVAIGLALCAPWVQRR